MSRILVLLLMISTYALASEVKDGGSDIVQRTVNFILFAGLVWYLVGEPIKKYFTSRSQSIADELQKVQDKLDESMALKKEALAKVTEAEKFAQELAETSKKENKMISDALIAQGEAELETLTKQTLSKREFEERKMVREVVEEIVTETLSQSADSFDKDAMATIILKKVA